MLSSLLLEELEVFDDLLFFNNVRTVALMPPSLVSSFSPAASPSGWSVSLCLVHEPDGAVGPGFPKASVSRSPTTAVACWGSPAAPSAVDELW